MSADKLQLTAKEKLAANNFSLEGFSEEDLTPELCSEAVWYSAHNMEYVPKHMVTDTMRRDALRTYQLQFVPVSERTPELMELVYYDSMVSFKSEYLAHVPEHLLDWHMCRLALDKSTEGTPYIPERLLRENHASLIDGKYDGFYMKHLPADLLCEEYLEHDDFWWAAGLFREDGKPIKDKSASEMLEAACRAKAKPGVFEWLVERYPLEAAHAALADHSMVSRLSTAALAELGRLSPGLSESCHAL